MTIFKILMTNKHTGQPTTVFIKAETFDIAGYTAIERYNRSYTIDKVTPLTNVEDTTTNDKPDLAT